MKKSKKEVSFAKVLQDQSWAEEEEEALELPFCFASNSASISGWFKRLGFAASWDDKKALELPSVLLPQWQTSAAGGASTDGVLQDHRLKKQLWSSLMFCLQQ